MKQRADILLTQKGACASRSKAALAITEGKVTADGRQILKPAELIDENSVIEIVSPDRYVSRGAYKLLGAIEAFDLSFEGLVVADIGASTGGFTQVLLENGAKKVFAVDVGEDQMSHLVAADPRVVQYTRTNARFLDADMLKCRVDAVVMDVSFISQSYIYPAISRILKEDGFAATLIKPQFECGRQKLGKNGILRDPDGKKAAEIIKNLSHEAEKNGLCIRRTVVSPIKGGDGNREYLAYIDRLDIERDENIQA